MAGTSYPLETVARCPVCGGAPRSRMFGALTDRVFGVPGEWTLWRCRTCLAGYLDPRLDEATIGEAYRTYYTHGGERGELAPAPAGSGARARMRNGYLAWRYGYGVEPAWTALGPLVPLFFPMHALAFDALVRNQALPRPGARLLDVGCGGGEYLAVARSLGWAVTGQEVDPVAAARARERGLEVIGDPLERAGLPEGGFDAVTLNHVLEHLHDPVAVLEEVRRVLRPGGSIWIATPNLDSPLRRMVGAGWRGLEPPRHLVLFARKALRVAVRKAGFTRLAWRRKYPLTRWMLAASDRGASRPIPGWRVRLLELTPILSQRWAEELVLSARKPDGGRP